jgi:hypothetical protein
MACRLQAIGRALAGGAASKTPVAAAPAAGGKYSMAEVALHADADSCWVVVADEVYVLTDFLDEHPGGKALLLSVAGTDATNTFNGIHPDLEAALTAGDEYKLGALVSEAEAPPPPAPVQEAAAPIAAVPADGAASVGGGEVHFHLPETIKDMSPEQLASLTAGAAAAAEAAAGAAAATGSDASAEETAIVADSGIATDVAGLHGSATPAWNSGGTADALPAERALASFDVEKMINILDGGEEETKKRRWIIGAGDIVASSELFGAAKYDLPRDGEDGAIASAFEHFMRVHGPWLEQMYVPTGNETMYMSMGNMMGGCAYPTAARFRSLLALRCRGLCRRAILARCWNPNRVVTSLRLEQTRALASSCSRCWARPLTSKRAGGWRPPTPWASREPTHRQSSGTAQTSAACRPQRHTTRRRRSGSSPHPRWLR